MRAIRLSIALSCSSSDAPAEIAKLREEVAQLRTRTKDKEQAAAEFERSASKARQQLADTETRHSSELQAEKQKLDDLRQLLVAEKLCSKVQRV